MVAALVAGIALSACTGPRLSTAAPPTVVCGTTIWDAPAGAVVLDVSDGGTVTNLSVGGYLFLRVNRGCQAGASVTIVPAAAGKIMKTARARDGRAAAVVIMPERPSFDIRLKHADDATELVKVRLGSIPQTLDSSPSPSTTR